MAYLPTGITSLVNTVPSSVIVGASIFGLAPVEIKNTNLNIGGSVISFQSGTWTTSLVSTIPSSVIVGVSVFGQLPAGTAPIGSVAVLQGTNPWNTTSRNAPIVSWVSGIADLRSNTGGSVAVIAAQGTGITINITGLQVANYGPTSVLVTLAGNSQGGSILAYTIGPAGGGSNIVYPNALKTGENLPFTASINAISSVLISAQGFTI